MIEGNYNSLLQMVNSSLLRTESDMTKYVCLQHFIHRTRAPRITSLFVECCHRKWERKRRLQTFVRMAHLNILCSKAGSICLRNIARGLRMHNISTKWAISLHITSNARSGESAEALFFTPHIYERWNASDTHSNQSCLYGN